MKIFFLKKKMLTLLISLGAILLASISVGDINNIDPYEEVNRKIFHFNNRVDQFVLTPVARTYRFLTPNIIERGISNFFSNLKEPINAINSFLQGKPDVAVKSLARFAFNSTVGLYGLVDIMSPLGLESHSEDFSQTLSVWNVDPGPYLMLPILGPSDVRGLAGKIVDGQVDFIKWNRMPNKSDLLLLNGIQKRASYLGSEPNLAGDPYVLMRSAYVSRRSYEEKDGIVVDIFLDDPLSGK